MRKKKKKGSIASKCMNRCSLLFIPLHRQTCSCRDLHPWTRTPLLISPISCGTIMIQRPKSFLFRAYNRFHFTATLFRLAIPSCLAVQFVRGVGLPGCIHPSSLPSILPSFLPSFPPCPASLVWFSPQLLTQHCPLVPALGAAYYVFLPS